VRTALYPGSFDPLHNGHMEIIEIAARLFDQLVVAAIRNPGKGEVLLSLEERQELIRESCAHLDNVKVVSMSALTVDVAAREGADVIVKGVRVFSDFESELMQAQMNKAISGTQTILIPCATESSFVASKYVKDFVRYGAADRIGSMVPEAVARRLQERFGAGREESGGDE
jgi:pantetheine-phosphate adenylyltransferase